MITFIASSICLLLGYWLGYWYRGEKASQQTGAVDFASRGGIYLEPRGGHDTNPFDAQDKPQSR